MTRFTFLVICSVAWLSICMCANSTIANVDDNFNTGWQFYKSKDTTAFPPALVNWETVDLPHTANLEQLTVKDQWQGICFYKKKFKLDQRYYNKIISLQFDAAMNVSEVWVNGKKMTRHMGGYLPFVIELNGVARFDTINTVLVRLDNRDNPITGPKPLNILDFNMYGGLYRNAHLIVKEKIHLSNPVQAGVIAGGGVFFSTILANKWQASFEIRSHVQNETNQSAKIIIKHQLLDKSGKVVATLQLPETYVEGQNAAEVIVKDSISAPQLWSPAIPYLYTLKTKVFANGELTDEQVTRVGIRTVHITPEGLWLNGEKTFLRGVNRHQEYPYVGYALSDAAQYRDAYKIKQAGFDFVRCSHYPVSPAFLSACDELGIMALDAILGWQYFGNNEFEKLSLRSCRELIRRDRNHPCILAWELSINEASMPKSFTDSAHIIAHEEFLYNGCYSAGWMLQSYDIYIEARQHRHKLYPEKPLLVSEYGDWEYFAQNAGFNQEEWKNLLEEERNSRQPRFAGEKRMLQQVLNIQEAHNDNLSTHAFADGYWVMFDYNRGMAPDQEYSGVMDIFRLPKYSYYFFKSQRNFSSKSIFAEPVVFIASYWQPGTNKNVKVFSNCEEVELFIDGKSVGRKKPDSSSFSINLNHPPFTFNESCTRPGTIKALGYINGKIVAKHSISTPSVPDHLTLRVDESGISPTRNDIIFVYAYINDSNNNIVYNDNREVTFNIEGATLIGPAKVNAQAGIATALVRTGNSSSEISITAIANGLKSFTSNIQIH
jgi:beta-galactosidase